MCVLYDRDSDSGTVALQTTESNRATATATADYKPPDEGRFVPVPEGEPRQTRISPLGKTMLPRAAHLLAQSGHSSSVLFSRGNCNGFYPYLVIFGNLSAKRQNTGISPLFARTFLEIAPEGGLG